MLGSARFFRPLLMLSAAEPFAWVTLWAYHTENVINSSASISSPAAPSAHLAFHISTADPLLLVHVLAFLSISSADSARRGGRFLLHSLSPFAFVFSISKWICLPEWRCRAHRDHKQKARAAQKHGPRRRGSEQPARSRRLLGAMD